MANRPDDICPRIDEISAQVHRPAAPPIFPASVYACENTDQAQQLLEGKLAGYVYQRDGHPNADLLAEKCRELHAAERAAVTSSGMAALALAMLSQLESGDHMVISNQLYGRSTQLLKGEAMRLGIRCTEVDTCDPAATRSAMQPDTELLVVETIANPLLRVADIRGLAEIAHGGGACLLVDNTFATPVHCQPLRLGADLVIESVSKTMNGHSDVMLGLLCGRETYWDRVPLVLSAWGLASSPFDCWLASRGLATLAVRVERASANALSVAEFLCGRPEVERVDYPGLPDHVDHAVARSQFVGGFGNVVTFHLSGGRSAADAFIAAAKRIPFCPSLGEAATTLSHPQSTSHRGLSAEQQRALGITGGTIRLSVGIESFEFIRSALEEAFGGFQM